MILVDSNILIDLLEDDSAWIDWSQDQLDRAKPEGLCISPFIYAEIAPQFAKQEALDAFLSAGGLAVLPLTREALFQAGRAHARYRQNGGKRDRVLPDFLIGAQAEVAGCRILTRDQRRYRTYFPAVELITP